MADRLDLAEDGGGVGYFERYLTDAGLEPSQFEQDVTQQPGRVYDTILSPRSRAETVPHPLYGEVEEPYEFDPAAGIMGMAGRALAMYDRKLEGLPVSDEQLAASTLDLIGPSASAVYLKGASNAAPGTVAMLGAAEGLYTPAPIRAKAVEARSLKSQGATDKEVFDKTGIFPGLDKQLRFEIDDREAKLAFPIKFDDEPSNISTQKSKEFLGEAYGGTIQGLLGPLRESPLGISEPEVLGDILHHPELYKVYPFMKDTPISALPKNVQHLAGFRAKGPMGRPDIRMSSEAAQYITIDDFAKRRMQETGKASKEDIEKDVVSALLHELQHYAQYVDDLNRGGNRKMFLPESIDGAEQSAQFAIDFAKSMAAKNGFKFDSKLLRFDKSLLSLEKEIDLLMRRQEPGFLPEDAALQEAKELKKLLKLQEEVKQGLGGRYDTVKTMESLLERTKSARDRSYELYRSLGGEIEARAVQERFRGNRKLKESPIDTLNLVKGKSEPLLLQRNVITPDELKIKQDVEQLNDYLKTTLNTSLNSDPELIKAANKAHKEHGDLSKLPSDLAPNKKRPKNLSRSGRLNLDMFMEPERQLSLLSPTTPVFNHNIPTIAGRVVDQLYSPDQTFVNRADLFINPDRMGETAPSISKKDVAQLLNDIRQQIDVQNLRLEIQGKEVGVTPSEELKQVFSQKLVTDRLVDFIRNEAGVTDPEQLQRMVSEIVMTTTSKMDPEGMAAGGVVSLKNKAVNMNRGPRSNGIMQYVPYMTGATNGY